jgi:Ca2+-transporting ATPase
MQRGPHRPTDGLWANGLGERTAWVGALIGVATLVVGFSYYSMDLDQWQTMMFTTLAFMQVGQAFATRSSTESLRTIGLGTNRAMLGIAAGVIVLQFAAVYTPLSEFLKLDSLSAIDMTICALMGIGLLAVIEIVKAVKRHTVAPGV